MADTELQQAIEAVYWVFAGYPGPTVIYAEEDQKAAKVLSDLTSAPLRELSGDQLGNYAASALLTMDSDADHRHFLPRILELGIHAGSWHSLEPWHIAEKLKYANWRSWPTDEQQAVEHFFMAAWAATVADDSIEPRWFVAIVSLGLDMEPALRIWIDAASPCAIAKCAKVIDDDIAPDYLRLEGYLASYMKLGQRECLRAWLLSSPVRQRMRDMLRSAGEDWAHEYRLRRCLERLDRIAAMPPERVAGMLRTELERSIEDAYRVFARFSGPTSVHAAPGYDAAQILKDLTSAPLRELPSDRIGLYATRVLLLMDSDADYRYFLPRILELAAAHGSWVGFDPAVIAKNLAMSEWRSWREIEKKAVERVFFAAFEEELLLQGALQDWIVGIALAEMGLQRALDIWLAAPLPNAMIQCADAFRVEAASLADKEFLVDGFWAQVPPEIRGRFTSWLTSGPVRRRLRDALPLVNAKSWKHNPLSAAIAALDRIAPLD
jgi:hypothetical protein